MLKGDATWATHKIILGWLMDTCATTVHLPPRRVVCLFELLDSISPKQRRTMVNKWQKLMGELHSMVLAIPGGKGLFSVLQEAPRSKCAQGTRVKLSSVVYLVLADFRWLAEDLIRRPKHIAEITPKEKPDTLGAQDDAVMGMGGVHFDPQLNGLIQAILWRCPFPEAVQQRRVTFDNPGGDINNSELDWLLASPSMTYWRKHSTFERQPSTIPLTTLLQSGDNRKGPPLPVAQRLVSFVSKHSTNDITATCRCSIKLLEKPMQWPTTAAAYDIFLTPNCLPILPFYIPRVDPGSSATCASQCDVL
jgi:hypothetical protein